jgi:hypothetical protein
MIRALLGISLLLCVGEVFYLAGQGHSPRSGYAPEQPIPFSHKLHAGDMGLDCQYCHTQPEKGRHATVPSLNVCMNCHSQVKRRVGASEDSVHLAKLREHFANNEPVRWIKVHDTPDYVYFSHRPHVKTAGISCQTCHGPVENMDKVTVSIPFNMGWCLDCHRQKPGYINAPVWNKDNELIRHASFANMASRHSGECQTDKDCRRSQTCSEADNGVGVCGYSDYAESAHLNTAGPQNCTTCHR